MDAPLDTEFLQIVRHRMLDEYPGQIRACLDALGEDDVWWRPHEQANAAGNLVLHLAGSNQFYLGHAIGGGPDVRDREAEFGARGQRTSHEVFAVYDAARATVQQIGTLLAPLGMSDITTGGGGADIGPIAQAGNVPTMAYLGDAARYFVIHHTAADTIERIAPEEVSKAAAAIAVVTYAVAEMPERLPK